MESKKNQQSLAFAIDKISEKRTIWRKEINHWQRARVAIYSQEPRFDFLQDVYTDIMLDDQLTTAIQQRILRTQNKTFAIFNKDGTKDDEKTKLINKGWLYDLIGHALNSNFYGYSLMVPKVENGEITKIINVDRSHINPINRLLLKDKNKPMVGLEIDDYPLDLLWCQFGEGFGLLEKAAPLTILKRHSWASWDEFEKIFGIPIRIAKYLGGNEGQKSEMIHWLEEMGSAAIGLFPQGTELEILENSKNDAFNVYLQKIKRVDEGISKLILGQTMTTESGSSKSQAEVHERTLQEIIDADERTLLLWLNDHLMPLLIHYDYPFTLDLKIGVEKIANPKEQIEIDSKLMSGGVALTANYIERVYGVEVESVAKNSQDPDKKKSPVK